MINEKFKNNIQKLTREINLKVKGQTNLTDKIASGLSRFKQENKKFENSPRRNIKM